MARAKKNFPKPALAAGPEVNQTPPAEETAPPLSVSDDSRASATEEFLSEQDIENKRRELEQEHADRLVRIDLLAATLSQMAKTEWGNRQLVEQRWLEDMRQYDGIYDEAVMKTITANKGSQMFVNITRPKTKTARARLSDMLFPTDDRNWDAIPTPVPELKMMAKSNKPWLSETTGAPMMGPPGPPGPDGQPTTPAQPLTYADRAANIMRKAKIAAEGMVAVIDDQLTESAYDIQARMAINDACLLGTGIMKGPIVYGRTRRVWEKRGKLRVLTLVSDDRPGSKRVDPWNFFPDSAASCIEECRYVFERMFMPARTLAGLAKDPHYIGANILRALQLGAGASHLTRNPTMEKRDSSGTQQSMQSELFEVWEYHGPIENADLHALGLEVDNDMPEGVITGCVVFVGGIVIKAYLNPLETGDLIYSPFNYAKDESSIFGFGVPYLMRASQRMLNGAVRALMDNAGLSAGPQIVINKKAVQPADGNYTLARGKVWELTDATKKVEDVMKTFNIDSHQPELQAIIALAQRFADEESGLPTIMQGEQGTNTKTLGGMSLLNNNANVITRDTVKNWDDGVTTPLITRFYDWNMQNHPDEAIKGDFEIDARGSSVLLSREIQSQNLMMLGANYAASPTFGPMLKPIDLLRKIVQAMHLAADDIVKTDDEYEGWLRDQAQGGEPPEVQAEKLRQQFEIQQLERELKAKSELEAQRHANRMQEAELEFEDNLIRYASQERVNMNELRAMLAAKHVDGNNKRIIQADELKFKAATGKPGI